jgi:hypothetical protein
MAEILDSIPLSETEKTILRSILNSLVSLRLQLGQLRSKYLAEEKNIIGPLESVENSFMSQLKTLATMKGITINENGWDFDSSRMEFVKK